MNKAAFRLFSIAVILALLVSFLPAPHQTARALSSGLVISQVYGGGGNSGAVYTHDFVEIFNRGITPVPLDGLTIQYTSATGTGLFGSSLTLITPLSGSLAPGQYLLVQEASNAAVGSPLPTPDIIDASPIAISATGGKVALVNSTAGLGCNGYSTPCSPAQLALIIDLVGWDGANFFETAPALATTNSTAVIRKENGCAETDNNAVDFVVATPTPRNSASPANICPVAQDPAPSVVSISPVNGALNVARNANITITFSEPVNLAANPFNITCTKSQGHTFALSGDSVTFTLNPDVDFSADEICTITAYANAITDVDTIEPADNMAFDFMASFTTINQQICGDLFTPIFAIQGSGSAAAITGVVTTEGVVVGDFEASGSLKGFYLQDVDGDRQETTSDGIFVFTGGTSTVDVGEKVRVTGYARERFNQTTLNGSNSDSAAVLPANILKCGTASVPYTEINLPFTTTTQPEQYEGMLVKFPQPLVISEYFNYDRYGEIVLGLPQAGETRLYTPTNLVEPGAPAIALADLNARSRITLDDVNGSQNPSVLRHPNGSPFSLTNRFRGGDVVQNAVGVLGFDFSLYRIMPTAGADFTPVNLRTDAPQAVGGTVRLAAMNTLNFFLTADYPTGNPLDNKCGPLQNVECRGWDSDQSDELNRQRTKLLQALVGLNADVIGLNELENTTGVEPLADLVAGLNAAGVDPYAYVNTGTIGTDAIKVGMIYRSDVVMPVGEFKLLTSAEDPRFLDTKSRPSLAQTFEQVSTGSRFTVVVNHFKSKGSDCNDIGDPDAGDGQGNCNLTRTAAAEALVDWLSTDPTGSGDPDFIILGDLNSYAMEDPIGAIVEGPDDVIDSADDYTNLISKYQGEYAYSYVFDGQVGYLDHALASPGMTAQVTGVTDWHINADEPDVLDYDTSFKPPAQDALYEPNAFRTSDHDAVIVGLNLMNLPPTASAGGPYTVTEGQSITLQASGADPEGLTVTFAWDLDQDGIFETAGQTATFNAVDGTFDIPVNVQVMDATGRSSTASAVVHVLNAAPVAGAISAASAPVPVTVPVAINAAFTDAGILDTHTAVINWGDGASTAGVVVEAGGNGSVSGSHAYTVPGLYIVTLTITDKDGGSASQTFEYIVTYDPNGGFVIGGGWIYSPAGAYKANPSLEGKASFGFVAKYLKGANVPVGSTEFQFKAGNLNFKSTSFDWLVVAGSKAQFKGVGTINGEGVYQFIITADDGKPDTFRIKISGDSGVIYDNGSQQALDGGSIQILK